jgi:hypothetical protein
MDVEVHSIFPDTLRQPQKHNPAAPMQRHAANWATVLRALDDGARAELRAAAGKRTGDITQVNAQPSHRISGFVPVPVPVPVPGRLRV